MLIQWEYYEAMASFRGRDHVTKLMAIPHPNLRRRGKDYAHRSRRCKLFHLIGQLAMGTISASRGEIFAARSLAWLSYRCKICGNPPNCPVLVYLCRCRVPSSCEFRDPGCWVPGELSRSSEPAGPKECAIEHTPRAHPTVRVF